MIKSIILSCILALNLPLVTINSSAGQINQQPDSSHVLLNSKTYDPALSEAPQASVGQNDFQIFRKSVLDPLNSIIVNEPSVANKGNIVFYTGNRYAARSTDGGQNWNYVNPFKNMGDERVKFADINNNDKWDYRDDGTVETIIYDRNNNNVFDTGDERLNGTAIQPGNALKYSDLISFTDLNDNDLFDGRETLVYDANGNLSYDSEDTHLAGPAPPSSLGGFLKPDFCCDQDVIYLPAWSMFVWIRQAFWPTDLMGIPLGSNRFRLGVSTDGGAWEFSDIHPADVKSTWSPDLHFDFPILAFSNNFLYITTTVCCHYFDRLLYGVKVGSFGRMYTTILRVQISLLRESPLNLVKDGRFRGQSYIEYHDTDELDDPRELELFAPVQGANSVMYWGTHVGDRVIRLFEWAETGTVTWKDIAHPPFASTLKGEASCPSKITESNRTEDACQRTNDRIRGGWVAKGVIGFLWNVKQDATPQGPDCCTYPYVDVVRIDEDTKTFLDNPRLSSNQHAVLYGWASPNLRGDLGVVAFTTGGSQPGQQYPALVAGIQDNLDSVALQLAGFTAVARSTNGPETDEWGDFIRVRPFSGAGYAWVGTGYTLQGGNTDSDVEPLYFVFGRSRDNSFDETVPPTWPSGGNLTPSNIAGGVRLAWTEPVDKTEVAGYWIYQESPSHQNSTLLATLPGSDRTFDVLGLKAGQTFVFRVTAFDPAGNVAVGPSVMVCVACLPAILPFAVAGTILAVNWIGGAVLYLHDRRRGLSRRPIVSYHCQNCGGPVDAGSDSCPYCGEQQSHVASDKTT